MDTALVTLYHGIPMIRAIGMTVFAAALLGCADHPTVPEERIDQKFVRLDPGHPMKFPTSYYSQESQRNHEEGTCVVKLTIGVDGRVQEANLTHSTGYKRLDDNCVKYLRTVQMLPAIKNGAPIVSSIEIPLTFGLSNDNLSMRRTPAKVDTQYPLNLDKFYPLSVRDLGEQGSCIVNAHIKANGVVRDATIVKTTGFATLDDACIKAVLSIWFIPATENGKAIESWADLPIIWSVPGTKQPEIDPTYRLKVGDAFYPATSRTLHEEGECIVAIFVSEDGTLVNASVDASSGFPMLDQATLSAVKEAKFTPGIKNGVPAALSGYILINWRLNP